MTACVFLSLVSFQVVPLSIPSFESVFVKSNATVSVYHQTLPRPLNIEEVSRSSTTNRLTFL